MASGTFTLFSKNKADFRIADIVGAAVKILLTTSSYTPDVTVTGNSLLADIANELANGNGYTTGGIALSSLVDPTITGGYKFSSASPVWTASGTGIPAWRNAVMYVSGTLWGKTSPLLGYFLGDATPADIPLTTSGNTLTLTVPAGGWFDIT
jgi:hypothetical protein